LDLFPQHCAELGAAPFDVAFAGVSRLASGKAATSEEEQAWRDACLFWTLCTSGPDAPDPESPGPLATYIGALDNIAVDIIPEPDGHWRIETETEVPTPEVPTLH
jgi:hypothetical protein